MSHLFLEVEPPLQLSHAEGSSGPNVLIQLDTRQPAGHDRVSSRGAGGCWAASLWRRKCSVTSCHGGRVGTSGFTARLNLRDSHSQVHLTTQGETVPHHVRHHAMEPLAQSHNILVPRLLGSQIFVGPYEPGNKTSGGNYLPSQALVVLAGLLQQLHHLLLMVRHTGQE